MCLKSLVPHNRELTAAAKVITMWLHPFACLPSAYPSVQWR